MGKRKNYEKGRVIERVTLSKIREICPDEKVYDADNVFYFICRLNDETYPDVAIIIKEFYDRYMFEHIGRKEIVDMVEKFLKSNNEEREQVAKMVKELCLLPDMEINDIMIRYIDEIFERYKSLKPVCDRYKLCYLLPTTCRALDLRRYKGKPTIINRTDFVIRIVKYAKGDITKEEALKLDVWYEKILPSIGPTDTVKEISAVPVREHEKLLSSERFTNKKGDKITVDDYIRMQKNIEKGENYD